ncbi:hypothetical protein TNCV_4265611 [Trichonephila clavipes]|nr:hypothetical protein TNCV_4265611 [Trichonephila clavipes]
MLTTRELLAMDLVIKNHGQVKRTTPELAPPLLIFTPIGGCLSLDILMLNICTAGVQRYQARTHDTPATSPLP